MQYVKLTFETIESAVSFWRYSIIISPLSEMSRNIICIPLYHNTIQFIEKNKDHYTDKGMSFTYEIEK